MVLIIYDVATLQPRRRVERLLRGASFVFLFGNVRWTRQPGDRGALLRRLRYPRRTRPIDRRRVLASWVAAEGG
jgi:hypothetical protein